MTELTEHERVAIAFASKELDRWQYAYDLRKQRERWRRHYEALYDAAEEMTHGWATCSCYQNEVCGLCKLEQALTDTLEIE